MPINENHIELLRTIHQYVFAEVKLKETLMVFDFNIIRAFSYQIFWFSEASFFLYTLQGSFSQSCPLLL
jgi:hypothetical protein